MKDDYGMSYQSAIKEQNHSAFGHIPVKSQFDHLGQRNAILFPDDQLT